jgi:hypothetical protein
VRPRLAALAAAAFVAAPLLLLAAPAEAATPTVTITWDGTKFTTNPTVASGTIVKWKNAGTQPTAGNLRITYKSGPTKFNPISVAPGATSTGTKLTGGSAATKEVVHGSQPVLVQTNVGDGTITIQAVGQPVPAPSHSPTSHPTTKPTHTTKPAPAKPAPAPKPAPPTGVTNPPPLGVGAVPAPAPSPAGPGPQVAGPQPVPAPTETAAPTTTEVPPQALGQSVPARKYGLPGALAAVLLAGVAVGVVRLARVEYANGNGNGHHSVDGTTGPAAEPKSEPPPE